MRRDKRDINILIVEDNPGDLMLVEDFLEDEFLNPNLFSAKKYSETEKLLLSDQHFDLILLDLGLPDMYGQELVSNVQEIAGDLPIIILTGYTNLDESLKLLSQGISDYLIKDELNSSTLYKSIVYAIQRKSYIKTIKEAKTDYNRLFELGPQPMFVYDLETLRILNANQACLNTYKYNESEFLQKTVLDIRPDYEKVNVVDKIEATKSDVSNEYYGQYTHLDSHGNEMIMDIYGQNFIYEGARARLILAFDMTERQKHLEAIEHQNEVLREIAWTQSHTLRAPLSRMMGLIDMIKLERSENDELDSMLSHIQNSATELDEIIQTIVQKSNTIKETNL